MRGLLVDFWLARRGLAASPGSAAACVIILALGLVAVATPLPALRAALFPAYPEDVVVLALDESAPTPPLTERLALARRASGSLEGAAAHAVQGFSVALPGGAAWVQGAIVSLSYFEVVQQLAPRMGSTDLAALSRGPMLVVSDLFWRERLGARPDCVGSALRVDGTLRTIVAVMPPSLEVGATLHELWVPDDRWLSLASESFAVTVLARLRPSASPAEAESELSQVSETLGSAWRPPRVVPIAEFIVGPLRGATEAWFGGTLWALVAAGMNVATLLLARAWERESELALRRACGAPTARLARALALEGAWIGLAAAAIGLPSTYGLLRVWGVIGPEAEAWRARLINLDPTLCVAVTLASVGVGLAASLVPAAAVARGRIGRWLASGAPRVQGSERFRRRVIYLGVLQFGFLVAISAGAGHTFTRWWVLRSEQRQSAAWSTDVTLVSFRRTTWHDPGQAASWAALRDELRERMRGTPGVRNVATSSWIPPGVITVQADVAPSEGSERHRCEAPAFVRGVSDEFFRLLRLPIVSGRGFTAGDGASTEHVAVLGLSFIRSCPSVGEGLARIDSPPAAAAQVVGVANDVRSSYLAIVPSVYLSERQVTSPAVDLFVESDLAGRVVRDRVRAVLRQIDPDQAVAVASSLDRYWADTINWSRFAALAQGSLAALALVICVLGTQGVVRLVVRSQRGVNGVQLALGAPAPALVRRFLRELGGALLAGIPLGLLSSPLVFWGVEAFVPGVSVSWLPAWGGAVLLAAIVALVPAWWEFRRALATEPLALLRHE